MTRHLPALCLTLFLAGSALPLRAQENSTPAVKPPEHFYRLNLTVSEVDETGKAINPRSYSTIVVTGGQAEQIRTGAKIPLVTGGSAGNTQFQYIDTGINFDIHNVQEREGKLSLSLVTEVSSAAGERILADVREPVIRQNKWGSDVIVTIGKPTVVFSSDNVESKGKMQVELTATRID